MRRINAWLYITVAFTIVGTLLGLLFADDDDNDNDNNDSNDVISQVGSAALLSFIAGIIIPGFLLLFFNLYQSFKGPRYG